MDASNTSDRPDFVQQQYAFAAYIRSPGQHPLPQGIDERRMKIYSALFYNNVEGFMAKTYPVLRSIIPDERWHIMMRDYYARHRSHTPLFPEMPREFLKYLEHERDTDPEDPPFMLELAHYEWVELALSIADEKIEADDIESQGDLLAGVPVISPLAWVLSYAFPVHKISRGFQPLEPGEQATHLIVCRGSNDKVHFIEANPVTARLLQLIDENEENQTGLQLLEQIAGELNHPDPGVVIKGGCEIMQDCLQRGILLGIGKALA